MNPEPPAHAPPGDPGFFRGPLAWMAQNPVAANLVMLVLLVGGLFWSFQIQQEVFPSIELDRVAISVPYPGASPAEVEAHDAMLDGLTNPIWQS